MEVKPTLLALRRRHNANNADANAMITSRQIADMCDIRLADEFLMELGQPVDALVANKVINAFNALTGERYTFADISMSLKEGEVLR